MPEETEHIKVKIAQLSPYPLDKVLDDDLVYVGEAATGILRKAKVSQLPFGQGGGGGGDQPLVGSPFKARITDDGVTVTAEGTTVSDARLLGKEDYPVSSSQLQNAVFRDDEVEIDANAGTVFIPDFQLQDGEVLVLYPDGVAGSSGGGGNLQPILDRLSELERMIAPFTPGLLGAASGRVWWTGPLETIPIGWVVDTDMAGYFPMPQKTSDVSFATIGGIGGAKMHTNTIAEMPEHDHDVAIGFINGRSDNANDRNVAVPGVNNKNTSKTGSGTPWNIMNPYKVGNWIKYVGI